MSKQQTAVDWLTEAIEQHILTFGNLPFNVLSKLKKEAKAMEKEQIETAYNAGREFGCKYDDPETGEHYYNETFKTESE